jgi:cytochrome P450
MTQQAEPQFGMQLFGAELAKNPYPFYEQLRKNSPVTKLGPLGLWAVSKYDDVLRILRDPDTFSSNVSARRLAGEDVPPSMLFEDPPVHTRQRNLISKAFTPKVIELQRPAIQEYCDTSWMTCSQRTRPTSSPRCHTPCR